jgi:tRNA G18 (ribose-2'-O)-methylase SpoU
MDGKYYKKATMGAKKYETIEAYTLEEFLKKTKKRNLVAFERRPDLKDAQTLYDYKWPENPIMFFGSEKFGVPDKVLKAAKDVVSIPVYGVLNDFNVAMAVGMAAYDWMNKNRRE